jgi:hypothetical protein
MRWPRYEVARYEVAEGDGVADAAGVPVALGDALADTLGVAVGTAGAGENVA